MSQTDKSTTPSTPTQAAPSPPRIDLVTLLGGAREAIIVHAGQDYRLRITASGKLILTK